MGGNGGAGVTINRWRLRKVRLRRECLSRDLKEGQPGGCAFQAEERAYAKALRWGVRVVNDLEK